MKKIIRKEILALRKAMPVDLINEKSKRIEEMLISHPAYQRAEMIFAYVDAKGEVRTEGIIKDAWKNGKQVAVPKVHADIMKFYLISSYDDLEEGYFGIWEPKENCTEVKSVPEKSVVIMPGVAFDFYGNRIGYGKGYYDKYFGKYPDLYKIAIAYSMQIVPEIPADILDVKADCILTESEIIRRNDVRWMNVW